MEQKHRMKKEAKAIHLHTPDSKTERDGQEFCFSATKENNCPAF